MSSCCKGGGSQCVEQKEAYKQGPGVKHQLEHTYGILFRLLGWQGPNGDGQLWVPAHQVLRRQLMIALYVGISWLVPSH